MFKKVSLLFLVLFIGLFWYSSGAFWDEWWDCPAECKIKDGTPDFMLEYFNTIRKIKGNVQSELSSQTATNPSSITRSTTGRIQKDLLRMFNLISDWSWYYSTFKFYVELPLTQSLPYPVKRDNDLISSQVDSLTKTLENITRKWQGDIIVNNPCAWVEDVCKLESWTATNILWALIKNTKNLWELYRLSILWNESDYNDEILFTKSDFRKQFPDYYNSYTAENCSRCKWSFTEKIETAIGQITSGNKWTKNWTQRWIDAWNMLIGNVDQVKQREYERTVLAKELGRQWLNTSNANAIIGNLNKYNEQWFYSIDNNFIVNSYNTTSSNLENKVNSFASTLEQKFSKTGRKKIQIWELINTDQDVQNTQSIKNMVDVVYQTELPFANLEDTSSESLQTKLINYHISLTEIISELDKIIPTSEKVCNDQANGLWQCSY